VFGAVAVCVASTGEKVLVNTAMAKLLEIKWKEKIR
jgi:hypothetical protein